MMTANRPERSSLRQALRAAAILIPSLALIGTWIWIGTRPDDAPPSPTRASSDEDVTTTILPLFELVQRDLLGRSQLYGVSIDYFTDLRSDSSRYFQVEDREKMVAAVSRRIMAHPEHRNLRCIVLECLYENGLNGMITSSARIILSHNGNDLDAIPDLRGEGPLDERRDDYPVVTLVPIDTWEAGHQIAQHLVDTRLTEKYLVPGARSFYVVSIFDGTGWRTRLFDRHDVEHPIADFNEPASSVVDPGACGVGAGVVMLLRYIHWVDMGERDAFSHFYNAEPILRGRYDLMRKE